MGNNPSSSKNAGGEPFNPNTSLIKKYQDPRYGEVKLVNEKNSGQQMLLKEVIVNTKEAFDQEVAFYDKRILMSHPNLVKIYGYKLQDQQAFC